MSSLTGRELDVAIAERIEGLTLPYYSSHMPKYGDPEPDTYTRNWNALWRAILAARKKGVHTGLQTIEGTDKILIVVTYIGEFKKYCKSDDVSTTICQLLLDALDEKERMEKEK